MNRLLLSVFIVVSSSSFMFAVSTMWEFAGFLSTFDHQQQQQTESNDASRTDVFEPLLADLVLLALFVLAHSGLAGRNVRRIVTKSGLAAIERSVYVAITCLAIQMLIRYWQPVEVYLWSTKSDVCWWIFTSIHIFAWVSIYGGCILYDFAELIGVKQVYYYWRGFDAPMSYKSPELHRLYLHMRHPSFLAFSAIFWLRPSMALDRFLLALALTAYMGVGFKVDAEDYAYQQQQFGRKYYEEEVVFTSRYVRQ